MKTRLWEMEERRLLKMSDIAISLTCRAIARKENESSFCRMLESSGFVMHNASWKMTSHQPTPLQPRSD